MDEHLQTPASGAEAPVTTIPSTATMAQATAQARAGGKKVTPSRLVEQVGALQTAETIKQLQNQVKQLENQSRDTGKIFLATTTSLITSAFALVAALAWNDAIQDLFKDIFPPSEAANQVTTPQVISAFGYAVVVTIIVVLVIFYLTKLNTRVGGRSLIVGGSGEMKKD
jgi:predicted PurR-regulated permease PerM